MFLRIYTWLYWHTLRHHASIRYYYMFGEANNRVMRFLIAVWKWIIYLITYRCNTCEGSGKVVISWRESIKCPTCSGSGKEHKPRAEGA
jgi:hypothetical protein